MLFRDINKSWMFALRQSREVKNITVLEYHINYFRQILKHYSIDYQEIAKYCIYRSLEITENMKDLGSRCQNLGGNSGAFFYFTYDSQYVLKTITSDELLVLDSIIEEYTLRLTDESPSFFAKIFGVYKIKVNQSNSLYVILMENLVSAMDSPLVFDMKGSSSCRSSTRSRYCNLETMPKGKVYKDTDFFNSIMGIQISSADSTSMIESLRLDTLLLENNLVMDYSLLIIISEKTGEKTEKIQRNQFLSGKYVVCIGVIDYLQAYNTKKKLENRYKTLKRGEEDNFSAIPPKPYRKRFLEMVANVFTDYIFN